MKRVAVAGFQHETNTFAPIPTGYESFARDAAWPGLTRGEALPPRFKGLNIPISGFIGACPHEIVPVLWAMAEPGGYVTEDAFEKISREIVENLVSASADAIYLDLHGAMVTRRHDDAEAEILRRIRDRVGPGYPIAVSLDLHGNMSREFFELATVVTVYRTYPHVDIAATGARAAALLERAMSGGLRKSFRQIDFLIPITAQSTRFSPAREIYQALDDCGAVSADLCMGFPPADVPCCGPAVFAYGDTQRQADRAADLIERMMLDAEPRFALRLVDAAEAVQAAVRATRFPTVIADPQDNPGAGATGDTTGLLRALVEAGAQSAAISMIHDPETAESAHRAGVGSTLEAAIGGRHSEYSKPFEARVEVVELADGKFTFTGPMYGGCKADLGPIARLRIAGTGVTAVVGSERAQNADKEMFRVVGIEPSEWRILCVKSAVHFMADYQDIAGSILFAESPGANPCRLDRIGFTRLRPGMRFLSQERPLRFPKYGVPTETIF